jgi:site-specific DNA recombinase
MKTAIYVRVSTEEQAKEGYSVSAQKKKLKAFCVSQGWEVAGLYADEGISAKDMERPELQRMLKDIEEGKIECVLVYRLDRLTRSVLDLYKMLETFDKQDCKFKSATEVYDTTTAMGRMFVTIVAALAQWERENMGERIAFGFSEKARQGKWPLNFAPIGYDLNKEESKLYINPHEAKTVKLIFDLYKTKGSGSISKYLNDNKIYTKAGRKWTDVTVFNVLKSRAHCGDVRWNDEIYEDSHDPIISREEWLEAQRLIEKRNTDPPRSVSSPHIFSGKLKCPSCEKNLKGDSSVIPSGKKYYSYRCKRKSLGLCKGSKMVTEIKLENAFVDYLESFQYSDLFPEVAEIGERQLNKKEKNTVDAAGLEKELDKIESRKKKWQYAWAEEAISFDDFKNLMEEEKGKEQKIREQIDEIIEPEESGNINKDQIIDALESIKQNWIALKREEKKYFVQSFIEEIHYRHTGKTIVIDKVDFI